MPSASVALTVVFVARARTAARFPAFTASMRGTVVPAAVRAMEESTSVVMTAFFICSVRLQADVRLKPDATSERDFAGADAELVHLALVLVGNRQQQVREGRFL